MNRRSFLGLLAAGAAGFALDPERALWVPGKKTYFLPSISDDTKYLQALIDRAAKLGGTAYVQGGHFFINRTLQVPAGADLHVNGSQFTWSGNQRGDDPIILIKYGEGGDLWPVASAPSAPPLNASTEILFPHTALRWSNVLWSQGGL